MPQSPQKRPARLLSARVGALALVLALPAGCRSAAEHSDDADEEVYAILDELRSSLGASDVLRIDPPEDSLRGRIEGALAEGELPELEPLGLIDCIEIAAENSREYQDQREALFIEALDLTFERWRLSLQPTAGGVGDSLGVGGEADTVGLTSVLGLDKLLGIGTDIGIGLSTSLARVVSTGGDWSAVSGLSLSVTQPLLRGFGGKIVLNNLTQAERDLIYQARTYERFRRTFAFDIVSQVFRIAQSTDTLGNERDNLTSLTRIRERNEAFAEAGQMLELEVDQARQNELGARNSVVVAEASLQTQYDNLKLTMGLPVETEMTIRHEELANLFGLVVPSLDESDSPEGLVTVALRERLDHLTAIDREQDADRNMKVSADALRAGLDVTFVANAASDVDQPLDFAYDEAPWTAIIDLDLPINLLPERNTYRRAEITLNASRRARERSADFVTADIRLALRDLGAARERAEIQSNAAILAERRVESATLTLEAGRSDTRDLLESQAALIAAQNSAVRARVDFALARLALYRDMELLRVDADGVRVETEPLDLGDEE
ncbi:MAG: TolC family protein [Planctomycetota bacterium]